MPVDEPNPADIKAENDDDDAAQRKPRKKAKKTRAQLEAALAMPARDAFEAGVIAEAERLYALLPDRDAATAWADDRMRR